MPGNAAGAVDAPLDIFGGLVTDMAPADLPAGVSPDCADVAFAQGGVNTRPGLQQVLSTLAGNPTVNYIKTHVMLNQALRTLLLDSSGALYKESGGVLSSVATGLAIGAYGKSTTLFGREYLAISDGKFGLDLPRQFDDTNFDRVSQVGPGDGPSVIVNSETAFTIAAPTTGAVRSANVVTITTTSAHGFVADQTVVIAGVTDTSFNGTFTITSVPSTTTFTYAQTGANASSGNGTATLQGNIAPGVHKVAVIFKTRQGYLTRPSPAPSWTATANTRVSVTNIPTGPSNVVARILCFTAAGGSSFFYVGDGAVSPTVSMIIPDNTTTSKIIDFQETDLLTGTNVDILFKNVELGECAGVIGYASRLFWWGERNKANNWLNLTFDGGFSGNVPLGWTLDGTSGAGGSKESSLVAWGDAYKITGDGATAVRGFITQPAIRDANGVPLIAPNTDYSIRARVRKGGGLTSGTLHIHLFSSTAGINTIGLQVTAAQAGTSFAEFTASLTAPITTIPGDLLLRLYVDGTPAPNGGFFIVDNIEIYPTAQPYNNTLVRASRIDDPESYDGVNGLIDVSPNDGQRLVAAFNLRERIYLVKEHSLYVTEDDGVNEPSLWTISEVSRTVGTPSVNGVDIGEDWAVMAHRSGLYLFWGGEPVKISQEIQPTWDSINWQYGHTLWVRVDTRNKRILVGVPIGAATSPNRILVLDYRGLHTAEGIAFSALSGRVAAASNARKWAPWFITANAAALVERSDGTAQMFLGNGVGNGKVYQLSDTQRSDDGAAINSYYTTYFFLQQELEPALGMGAHRKLFQYLTAYVEGSGTLNLTAYLNSTGFASAQQSLSLSNPASKDLELPINITSERVAFKLGTNAVGSWFKLQKFTPSLRPDPWAPVRGTN